MKLLLKELKYRDASREARTKEKDTHFWERKKTRIDNCSVSVDFLNSEHLKYKKEIEQDIKSKIVDTISSKIIEAEHSKFEYGAFIFGIFTCKYNNNIYPAAIAVSSKDSEVGNSKTGNIFWSPVYNDIAKTILLSNDTGSMEKYMKSHEEIGITKGGSAVSNEYIKYHTAKVQIYEPKTTEINIDAIIKNLSGDVQKNIVKKEDLPYVVKGEYSNRSPFEINLKTPSGVKPVSFKCSGSIDLVNVGKYKEVNLICDTMMAKVVQGQLNSYGITSKLTSKGITLYNIYYSKYFSDQKSLKKEEVVLKILIEQLERTTGKEVLLVEIFGLSKKEKLEKQLNQDILNAKKEVDGLKLNSIYKEIKNNETHSNYIDFVKEIKNNINEYLPTFLKLFPKINEELNKSKPLVFKTQLNNKDVIIPYAIAWYLGIRKGTDTISEDFKSHMQSVLDNFNKKTYLNRNLA